jgi:hypothetical protein
MGAVPTSYGSPDLTPSSSRPGARESNLSRYLLAWTLVAPFVGFALAARIFDLRSGDWELWKAAALGALLMVPFAVGATLGARAVLKGFRGGWVGLLAHLVLGALAIGMPLVEALTD